jgi:rod shape-determining protein MreC
VIEFFVQRKATVILAVLLVAMLLLMRRGIGQAGAETPIERAVARASDPLVKGGSTAVNEVSRGWSSITELRGLKERNEEMSRELERLRGERLAWESERRENERLRRLLLLRGEIPIPSLPARVAAASPVEERTLLIDRGFDDGVRRGQPVVAEQGVVGKVIFTSAHLAKVLLLNDPASGIAVVHQDGRYQGVVTGRGDEPCELLYLPATAKVSPGDLIVTSGLDRLFPRGLPVGRVTAVLRSPDGNREIEVRPEAGASKLDEVLVLLTQPENTDPVAAAPGVAPGAPGAAGGGGS